MIVVVLIVLAARVHAEPGRPGSWEAADCAQARDADDDERDDVDRDDVDRDEPAPIAPHRASDDDLDFERFFDHDDSAAGDREAYEASLRARPASQWGRFDVGIAVRRRDNAPAHALAYQTGELWLVATWRR